MRIADCRSLEELRRALDAHRNTADSIADSVHALYWSSKGLSEFGFLCIGNGAGFNFRVINAIDELMTRLAMQIGKEKNASPKVVTLLTRLYWLRTQLQL
jgi:hypothetical protein